MPGKNAFPRNEHLTRKKDFQAVYENGVRCAGGAFVCYVLRRMGHGRKLGCAVSRKVGRAVARNRVKRHIREAYRTRRARLANDAHVVIVARPGSAGMDGRECAKAIERLFRKSGILATDGGAQEGDAADA